MVTPEQLSIIQETNAVPKGQSKGGDKKSESIDVMKVVKSAGKKSSKTGAGKSKSKGKGKGKGNKY